MIHKVIMNVLIRDSLKQNQKIWRNGVTLKSLSFEVDENILCLLTSKFKTAYYAKKIANESLGLTSIKKRSQRKNIKILIPKVTPTHPQYQINN